MPTPSHDQPQWVGKAHLVFDYFSCAAVADVYRQELVEVVGFSFNYKYENLDIFYDQRDVERHAALLTCDRARIKREPAFIKDRIAALLEASSELGHRCDLEALASWFKIYRSFLPTLGLVFGLELALERLVKSFLAEHDFYAIAFAKEMPTAQEQKSLLRLAQLPSGAELEAEVSEHVRRFAWLGNKMLRMTPFTEEHILERLTAARATAAAKLRELEENRRTLENGAWTVVAGLSHEQSELVAMYQDILALRTERADAVCQAAQLTQPLFTWVADRLHMTREELLRFSKHEIDNMLATGERQDPAPREKYSLSLQNKTFAVAWGSWGQPLDKLVGLEELRGTVACRGRARGIVKVVNDVSDMSGFAPGSILVAAYTNPNLLPAIEVSAAIVTNIGGLTSHAAIVSRELNKPCIIGTNIATQVLQNGDEVEVDAEAGVVKILQRL